MKGLSLWQPWASLVALGGKRVETRSWRTNYRGPLLIHAAARKPPASDYTASPHREQPLLLGTFCDEAMQVLGHADFDALPRGVVLAVAELVDCLEISTGHDCWACAAWPGHNRKAQREHLFGDYSPGRWAWVLGKVKVLPSPLPARGGQRLWNPAPELAQVMERLWTTA